MRRFRATYGLDEEHESDVETDEDEGQDSEEKEGRVDRQSPVSSMVGSVESLRKTGVLAA